MTRLRPDVDDVVGGVLRAHLPSTVTVAAQRSAQWQSHLPYVTARDVGGSATQSVRFRTSAEVDVQVWAASRREASDLDDRCLAALVDAQRRGTQVAGGWIARITEFRLGAELRTPDQPDGVWRWQASYTLTIRPALIPALPYQ